LTNSSSEHRDDADLEMLKSGATAPIELEELGGGEDRANVEKDAVTAHPPQPLDITAIDRNLAQQLPENPPPQRITASHPTPANQLDVNAELDSLSLSWQLAIPHPPHSDSSSISGILATIAANEPMTDTQRLRQELHGTRAQIARVDRELAVLSEHHHARVDTIEIGMQQFERLKAQTKQLAKHSKNQIEKVQEMLGSIEQIRTEIVTSLDKFGGYAEIDSMFKQLETTRHTLVIAHDRATTGQEAFYDSLQAIQLEVAARSHESEQKLSHYQESIQQLSQTISTDRLQIAGMSVELSKKLTDLHSLNVQIATTHAQIVEKSQTQQSKIAEIDRSFETLLQSVQQEKEQFYAITVEAIEKGDAIRSQLADIIKQISIDRDSIATLKADIQSVRYISQQEREQQLNNFNLRYQELLAVCNDFKTRQKNQSLTTRKLLSWLWLLSLVVVVLFVLSIWMLMNIR
jgi:DNA repair exonuclease SbcCD ATPase subunit